MSTIPDFAEDVQLDSLDEPPSRPGIDEITGIAADEGDGLLTGAALKSMLNAGLRDGFGFNPLNLTFLAQEGEACPINAGPGMVTLIGGAPGAGKSALVEQLGFGVVERNPEARFLIANIELSPKVLLCRQLGRLTAEHGLAVNPYNIMKGTTLPSEQERLTEAARRLESTLDRVCIVQQPHRLHAITKEIERFEPTIAAWDYVQRITADAEADSRINAGMVMQSARAIADRGVAVIAVSALARQKGASGSSYADAGLASFRESAELEYGADQAVAINTTSDGPRLDCVKNRYGMTGKYPSAFNGQSLRWKIGGRA